MPESGPPPAAHRLLLDLTPLRTSPAYLRFWSSGVAGGIGVQLTAVAIAIHVYELSGSTAAVALVGGLALGPMLLMGIIGGALVDAFDRRRVLIVASTISFLSPVGIAALAWAEVTELWPYYLFTTLSATVGALVGAARFAIHPRLVPREQLPAVAALSGLSAGLQAAVGPALAGLLVATVGFAWTYTIDVGLFLVGFWGIVSLPPILPETRSAVGRSAIASGFRFLRGAANLRTAIWLQFVSLLFGRSYAILPAVGAVVIGGDAFSVGLLTAAGAVGVIASGVFSGRAGDTRFHGRAITIATVITGTAVSVFGLLLLLFDHIGTSGTDSRPDAVALVILCLSLVLVGAADNITGIYRTTMMQSATPDALRGRLQGINTLVLTAGPRAGDVYAGLLAAGGILWLPPLLGGALIVVITLISIRFNRGFHTYDATEPTP